MAAEPFIGLKAMAKCCNWTLSLFEYRGFDVVDDVADVGIGDPGAGGEADAGFEEGLADAIGVGGGVAVDGLLVHGLPQRTQLDADDVQGPSHSLIF